jgi:inositol oxygenase
MAAVVEPAQQPVLEEEKKREDDEFAKVNPNKQREQFRDYGNNPRAERVRNFYKTNHEKQTVDFVKEMHATMFKPENTIKMAIWEALEKLDTYVDESDPDTNKSQMAHAMQTSEAIRAAYPGEEYEWFVLTGLLHDLGKIVGPLRGLDQWCVVGDTFPVGCQWGTENVFHEFFQGNPDKDTAQYQTLTGIYSDKCGMNNLLMSFGHDEYLYQVLSRSPQCKLPAEGLFVIRFHSFYPWHNKNGYMHFCTEKDLEMLEWVRKFQKNDLYSKSLAVPDPEALKPYYMGLIQKFFPDGADVLNW